MEVNRRRVDPAAIRATRRYESFFEEDNTPKRRPVMDLDFFATITDQDARFVMNVLLPRLRAEETSNTPPSLRTRLSFRATIFTPEGLQVFTNAFRNPSVPLTSLEVCIYHNNGESFRRLLASLVTNTTVKELKILNSSDDSNGWMAQLLRHKTDFSALDFLRCLNTFNGIFASLGHGGYPLLHKLSFCYCGLKDEGVELLVGALVSGNHSQLEELDLTSNFAITSEGLRSLCRLAPSAFPNLKALILRKNWHMLENEETVQDFANIMLMAEDAVLEKFDIRCCMLSLQSKGYIIIVKSMESSNCKLRWLDFCSGRGVRQGLRNQLIESLPKMEKLQHLTCHEGLCGENDQELVAAYRNNTSLFKVLRGHIQCAVTTPCFVAICKRNKFLFHIRNLTEGTTTTAATTTTTTATTTTRRQPAISDPSGQWMYVLAQVGQGPEGATPVFAILRAALANWLDQSRTSNNSTRSSSTSNSNNITTTSSSSAARDDDDDDAGSNANGAGAL